MSNPFPYDLTVPTLDGAEQALEAYRGQVLLVVNTASRCGFTPQYDGLEGLYRKHKDRGLMVLGFPCNQFMNQEPGDAEEIRNFCSSEYNVTFPMFNKVDVNGNNTHPLYNHLKKSRPGLLGSSAVKWNFTKFLVDRKGNVTHRFAPNDTPESMERHILRLLDA